MEISLYSLEECEKIAKSASLRFVQDSLAGIQRKKYGKGFAYFNSDGTKLTNKEDLARIRALGIPPAYTKVWISLLMDIFKRQAEIAKIASNISIILCGNKHDKTKSLIL